MRGKRHSCESRNVDEEDDAPIPSIQGLWQICGVKMWNGWLMGVILVCSRLSSHGGKLEVHRKPFFLAVLCKIVKSWSLSELLPSPPTAALLWSGLFRFVLFVVVLTEGRRFN